jgi:hypothetical protein
MIKISVKIKDDKYLMMEKVYSIQGGSGGAKREGRAAP